MENITAQVIEGVYANQELAACLAAGVPIGIGVKTEENGDMAIVIKTQVHVAFKYGEDGKIEEVLMKKEGE